MKIVELAKYEFPIQNLREHRTSNGVARPFRKIPPPPVQVPSSTSGAQRVTSASFTDRLVTQKRLQCLVECRGQRRLCHTEHLAHLG